MRLFVGIDGGGTKTRCVILDESGAVRGMGSAGSSNIVRVGEVRAFSALRTCLVAALRQTKRGRDSIAGVVAGLAGCGRAETRRSAERFFRKSFPGARCRVTTDLSIALASTSEFGPAVVIVAGTGSGALGRGRAGAEMRAGGWGPWASDEGSAFDIGRKAMVALARMQDGREKRSALARLADRALGVKGWFGLQQAVNQAPLERLPALFPAVIQAAERGDLVARRILRRAAADLGRLGTHLIGALRLGGAAFPVGLVGGVFGRSRLFDRAVRKSILQAAPRARITIPTLSPATAAARLAWRSWRKRKTNR
jgi:N-acetylglucosamine kinase